MDGFVPIDRKKYKPMKIALHEGDPAPSKYLTLDDIKNLSWAAALAEASLETPPAYLPFHRCLDDFLTIDYDGTEPVKYEATYLTWFRTIDYFMYLYQQLMIHQSSFEKGDTHTIPAEVLQSLANRYARPTSTHKNKSPANASKTGKRSAAGKDIYIQEEFDYVIPITRNKLGIDIPPVAAANYINLFYWNTVTVKQATDVHTTIYFEGTLFRHPGKTSDADISDIEYRDSICAPPYKLVDYLFHEASTGLSLSIELTASLSEFKNSALRTQIWKAFCESALNEVVSAPFWFTRIALCRCYINCFRLEFDRGKNIYGYNEKTDIFTEEHFRRTCDTANTFIHTLKCLYYDEIPIKMNSNETKEAIQHIESLLSKVRAPVDLMAYVDNPKYGLAIFCDPCHPKASKLLDLLAEAQNLTDSTKPRKTQIDEHKLYKEVHKMVRGALVSRLSKISHLFLSPPNK